MQNQALALELAYIAVEESLRLGAQYAEARFEHREVEEIRTRERALVLARTRRERGLGLRVLVRGTWSFVAVSEPNRHDVVVSARRAVQLARSAAILRDHAVQLAEHEPQRGTFQTPIEKDPASIPLEQKLELLAAIDGRLLEKNGIVSARSHFRFQRKHKILVTSNGSEIEQLLFNTGVGFEAGASRGDGLQTVAYPSGCGRVAGKGFEWVESLPLLDATERVADRALEQLSADPCPADRRTLILGPEAVSAHLLQTARLLEVDRIFAMETAGQTPPIPSTAGPTFQLGSAHFQLSLDPSRGDAAGTVGFDDEGVAAVPVSLVEQGRLRGVMTGREGAHRLGLASSTGSMRAASWAVRPQVRASNLVMGPGDADHLEALVQDTAKGVVVEGIRTLSMDPTTGEFLAVGEAGWEVEQGRRVRPVRNPAFRGRVTEFWGQLDAASRDLQLDGHLEGPKGRPTQFLSTGVLAPAARFTAVEMGSSDLPRSDSVDLPIVSGSESPPDS